MLRVVLDTSVLITALRSKKTPPSASVVVLREVISGLQMTPLLDQAGVLEAEYREVAARPEHALRTEVAMEVIDAIVAIAEGVDASIDPYPRVLRDDEDRMVIDAARAAKADVIITWNVRHIPADAGVRAETPPQLLKTLRALEKTANLDEDE